MRVKIISEEKIRTENPLKELWLQLRLFESEYYSKQFLKEKYHQITDDELNKLSIIFTSNIKQAYEYYSAASNVSILTSPLLYYYGMMCLTNVLWASLNKTEEIFGSHGLRSKSEGLDHFLSNEYITVFKKGSFSALHACFTGFPIKEKTKFYIKDVLSVIPELKNLFEKIYNDKPRLVQIENTENLTFDYFNCLHFQEILNDSKRFLKQQYNVQFVINLDDEIVGIDTPYILKHFEYPFQKNMNDELYFTLPIKVGNALYGIPETSAHFIVMNCLGMLVRYEPVKWLQIVSGKSSAEINLINQFVEVSKRKFPNIVLNGLLGKEVRFIMADENLS